MTRVWSTESKPSFYRQVLPYHVHYRSNNQFYFIKFYLWLYQRGHGSVFMIEFAHFLDFLRLIGVHRWYLYFLISLLIEHRSDWTKSLNDDQSDSSYSEQNWLTPQWQSSERNLPVTIVQKLDNLNRTIWNSNFSLKNNLKLQ